MAIVTRALVRITVAIFVLALAFYAASWISPWPGALIIRAIFDRGADRASQGLKPHVPPDVISRLNESYNPADKAALLDVFYPSMIENTERSLPGIVWIHGGAWISGSKDDIANYGRILAARGYAVVGVDYSIAPGAKYPEPVRQVNTALIYLVANSSRLHLDTSNIFLAGDSAGAHIAAQLANAISVPPYAALLGMKPAISRLQLRGLVLFCGAYDVKHVRLDGPFGWFLRTVLWSYSGTKGFMDDPRFATASVIQYVTADFPAAFVSAGNADPLGTQSHAFAEALSARGVRVDTLFFPQDYSPGLQHEYQFDLDTDAGRLAFDRMLAFLTSQRR